MPDATSNHKPASDPTDCGSTETSPLSGTYICFDFGQKRIGLAVGHSISKNSNPLTVVRNINGRPEWHHIDQCVNEWKPAGLVVGLPVPELPAPTMEAPSIETRETESHKIADSGSKQHAGNNQQLILSAAFSRKLRNRYKIPVYRCDERYSSIEAARLLAENRRRGNRKKVGREDLDKVAAAIILNQWFDNEFE